MSSRISLAVLAAIVVYTIGKAAGYRELARLLDQHPGYRPGGTPWQQRPPR